MSLFKKVLGAVSGLTALRFLVRVLSPKIPRLRTNTSTEQFGDIRAQNNQPRIGEPQTVLYGRTWFYPTLSQQPWSEYVSGEQLLHLRMRVSVGIATLLQLRVGDAPFTTFAGSSYQLLAPGEPLTLFHPNVYTADRLTGVELIAGILETRSYTGDLVFSGNRVAVPDDATSVAARAAAGINPFSTMDEDNSILISGSAFNDGTYIAVNVDGSNPRDFFDVITSSGLPVTFTPETVLATVSWGGYRETGSNTVAVGNVPTTFDAALSEIRTAPLPGNPTPLDVFVPGDIITATTGGAGVNRYRPYTILALNVDGTLVVTPAPANHSGTTDFWLLRRYYGPFPVCPPGDTVDRVAFDLLWPQGIGARGGERELTMRLDPQYQVIDDTGTPLSGWVSFAEIAVTARARNPYRRTFEYALPLPARVQVRLARVTVDATDGQIIDTVQWTGARGFIVARPGELPEIDVDSTVLAVTLRNTSALAAADDTKVNGLFQRRLETWDPGSQTWLPESDTSSVAWAALDKLRGRHTARGRQIPDAELDLPGFAAFHAATTAAGQEFNGQISVGANLRDNVNTILRLGRGELRYQLRDGRLGVYRDALIDPAQMFTDLNSRVSGYQVRARTENDATGVQVSYQEPAFNDEGIVGIGDTDGRPLKVDLRNGCTSREQAWREANFIWNDERFRRRSFSLAAELEPLVLNVGDRVLVQSAARGWGQAAEVVTLGGRALSVFPALDWSGTGHTVRFRDPYGVPGAAIACTRDGADNQLLLNADADVEITGDATGEQRTHLIFESSESAARTAIVNEIRWRNAGSGPGQTALLDCTLEDARVHASPGPAPADPYAPLVTLPSLVIVGLTLADSSGTVTASWVDLPAAVLYATDWRYAGAPSWTTAARGTSPFAVFAVPVGGTIEVRVQAFGSGGLSGPYATASLVVLVGSTGAAALAVSVTPLVLFASVTGGAATTVPALASASGGTPPYAFAWARIGGDLDISAVNAAAASTAFTHPTLATGETATATFRVTVTDAVAAMARGEPVTVTVVNTASGGTPGGGPAAPDGSAYRATNDGGLRLTHDNGIRVPHTE